MGFKKDIKKLRKRFLAYQEADDLCSFAHGGIGVSSHANKIYRSCRKKLEKALLIVVEHRKAALLYNKDGIYYYTDVKELEQDDDDWDYSDVFIGFTSSGLLVNAGGESFEYFELDGDTFHDVVDAIDTFFYKIIEPDNETSVN